MHDRYLLINAYLPGSMAFAVLLFYYAAICLGQTSDLLGLLLSFGAC